MKFLHNLFSKDDLEPNVLLNEPLEIPQEQWSALYITGIATNLTNVKALLANKISFNEKQIFEKELATNNKISVLNAIEPGFFADGEINAVVVLINASSFSEYANTLLEELYSTVALLVKNNPGAKVGERPEQSFNADELGDWLKQQRDKYFFIE